MSNKEKLSIVLKPYLKAKDIMQLLECGRNTALDVIKVVKQKFPDRLCIYGCEIRTCDFFAVYELKLEDFIRSAELESTYLNKSEVRAWS